MRCFEVIMNKTLIHRSGESLKIKNIISPQPRLAFLLSQHFERG